MVNKSEDLQNKYPLLFSGDKHREEFIRKRFESAWEEAKKAAAILTNFGAGRVVVFGSLTDISSFTERSDIDLAVSGIPDEKFYAAVGAVTGAIKGFKVDVLDMDDCKSRLKKAVERDGIEL